MASSSGGFDGQSILNHVTDFRYKDYSDKAESVSLYDFPIIGNTESIWYIDFSITKHVLMLWIVAAFTIAISVYATRAYRKNKNAKPKGIAHLFEILMEFIKSDIVIPNIGKKGYHTWAPLITTFFSFILVSNFIGMIPFFELIPAVYGSSTITGNFALTLALSVITFFAIIVAGTMKHGFIGHWKNLIPGGVPAPVLIILIPIEIVGMIIKPLALTLRLGANMTAGHIGVVAIFGIPMIIYQSVGSVGVGLSVGVVSVILNTAIYFLEFIVCFVQAYVFSLLSSVFIGMAIHADH